MRLRLKHDRLQEIIAGSTLSQNHWALKIGISRGHWSEIVNGKHPYLSPKTRGLLLDTLGVPVGELFVIESGVEPWADADFRRAISERYIIDREIGQGGMGAVYLARDVPRGRVVAVKVIAPETVSGIGVDQFLREIGTVAQLTHPNILPLFDSGAVAGHPFYVMPLIRGGSLRGLLTERLRMSVGDTVTFVRGIAAGLQHAHDERVLHCDIKPENVLVHDTHAYVMDFGIARRLHTEAMDWSLKNEFDLSAGTPAYVSPEQAAGERNLDARSDVYSLACMTFEMLAGRAPFEGTSTQAIVSRRFIVPPPPLRDFAPEVPREMQSVLERAMSLPREHRQPSVAVFARELHDAATQRSRVFAGASLRTSRAIATARRRLHLDPSHAFGRWFVDAGRDAVLAWRGLRRAPGFAAVVVLTIALALGANATMYGIADRLLLRPPAHIAHPEEVHQLRIARWTPQGLRRPANTLAFPAMTAVRGATTSLAAVAAAHQGDVVSIGSGAGAYPLRADVVTGGYFALFGPVPELGRFIDEEDDQPPAGRHVVVLSHGTWVSRFACARDVLGKTMRIENVTYEIVGVAPRDFTGPDLRRVDLWLPMSAAVGTVLRVPGTYRDALGWSFLQIFARVRPGTALATARDDATRAYRAVYARENPADEKAEAQLQPIAGGRDRADRNSTARVTAWLSGMAVIVLLIACANVANLILARGVTRRPEIAVRRALGISSGRLVRQLLAESLLLATSGCVIGLAIAKWGGGVLRDSLLPGVTWDQSPVNQRVLLVTGGATLFVAIVAGLLPMLSGSRADLATTLRAGGRGRVGAPRRALTTLLLTQITLATVLVIGAGLFVTSLRRAQVIDLGFESRGLVYGALPPARPGASYAEVLALYREVEAHLQRANGLHGAGIMIGAPLMSNYTIDARVPGLDSLPKLPDGGPYYYRVSAGAFDALRMRLVRGRPLTAQDDRPGAMRVVVVTETTARTLWPQRNPLAQCIVIAETPCAPVVGVVADVHRNQLREDDALLYFLPLAASVDSEIPRVIVARVDGDANTGVERIRREIAAARPDLPYVSLSSYHDLVDGRARSWSLGATMFTIFGALSALMAAIGVYGVLSYLVTHRTQELGVRAALGATPGAMMRMIVFGALVSAAVGVTAGIVISLLAAGAVEPLLFETNVSEPIVVIGAVAVLAVVTALAAAIPARRAARVDPLTALRE